MNVQLLCIVIVSVVVSMAIANKRSCSGYTHGTLFLDADCNRCYCNDGMVTCDQSGGCYYEGECRFNNMKYRVGEIILEDNCYQCKCIEDGKVFCVTLSSCDD
ncbi:BMP-binding endothelial regulator protein-like [Dreissena polymorpha]|uniref:Protease inhibitor n=1 Tax=Dreissena polymorpha TaxID=45954 RepID=A0A9D4GW05_DREPO|nr:BMP-binding endothelial regulator protein-like [Dreissena polymorpha]KAH3824065.1 hypothetical protein DPMN_125893 [Dreissena polymorpha]